MTHQTDGGERVLVSAAHIFRSAFDTAPATGMMVSDGRVRWIGDLADSPSADIRVDLGGLTLLPGLTDPHLHILAVAQARLQVSASDPSIRSLDDFLDRLRLAGRELAPGKWVIGTDVNEQFWTEQRLPDRFDLDRVLPDRPAAVRRFCGHVVCLNTAALEALRRKMDPQAIGIDVDDRGLTGIARELAAEAVFKHLPRPDDRQIVSAVQSLTAELARSGLTAANEAAVGFSFGLEPEWALWQRIRADCTLPLRLGFMLQADPTEADRLTGGPAPDPWWQIRTLKIFADGIIGARTAALSGGFADGAPPGPLLQSAEALHDFVGRAHDGGWQVAAHAIGDMAIDAMLNAYQRCMETGNPRGLRHRLEHLGLPGPDVIPRIVRTGTTVVTQPSFVYRMGDSWSAALGTRAARAFPAASLRSAGVHLAGSSDAPTGSLCPWEGISSFVTRRCASGVTYSPGECLTLAEALHAYTVEGAYAMHQESWRGRLEPGLAADFAVFSCNPLASDPGTLGGLQSSLTVVGGRASHDAADVWPISV